MTTRSISLRSQLPMVSENSDRAWVEFAYEGTWKGYHGGEFTFSRESFEQMISNFNAQANALPLKYEHPEVSGGGAGDPVPAAGWIHALELRGDQLWGYCEFTAQAARLIRSGEYRFCSVVVSDMPDRVTGEPVGMRLHNVGLTNEPFLDKMEPIRLSFTAPTETPKDKETPTPSAYVRLSVVNVERPVIGFKKTR